MKNLWHYSTAVLGLALSTSVWSACPQSGGSNVTLQILGSGGPGDSGGRASASYLLWIDGVGRILVDAGSGTKDQFYRASASFDDIDLVALSHLHPDHSAELPAILWPAGGSFQIAGPTGAGVFPSIEGFLDSLFGPGGAFHILEERIELDIFTVDVAGVEPTEVWTDGNISVHGRGVPHGDVPTIGYRVNVGGASIAFASDQTGSDPSFVDFVEGVDVLVIHMSGTEQSTGVIAELHAKPSVWGQMAADAQVGHVVVSHVATASAAHAAFSPEILDRSLAALRGNYSGPVSVGEDLMCIDVE